MNKSTECETCEELDRGEVPGRKPCPDCGSALKRPGPPEDFADRHPILAYFMMALTIAAIAIAIGFIVHALGISEAIFGDSANWEEHPESTLWIY